MNLQLLDKITLVNFGLILECFKIGTQKPQTCAARILCARRYACELLDELILNEGDL